MMVGEHEPVLRGRQPNQRPAHQRRRGEIKPRPPILRQDVGQPRRALGRIQRRQIDPANGYRHRRRNDLHRPAQPGMPEPGAQARMAGRQRLHRRLQPRRVERARQRKLQLHRVDVRRLRIVQRMKQQPFLQRRQRQNVVEPRLLALQPLDLLLRQPRQRTIARAAPARPGRRAARQRLQRPEPAARQRANRLFRHQARRPRPVRDELRPGRPLQRHRIDLDRVRQRHGRIQARPEQRRLPRRGPVRPLRPRKAPEIVEAKLRGRKAGQLAGRRRVQIAQQSIAEPVVGQRAQLLLDRLQRPPKLRPARQRRPHIARTGIEPHRKQAGEPAHRAREIDIAKHLLAAVTLHIQQHRIPGARVSGIGRSVRRTGARPPPVGNGQRQAGQQDVIDAAMKRRRHPRQQRLGDRRRQRQRDMPGRPGKVARRIERPVNQRQRRLAQHARPHGKLGHPLRLLRVARKPLRPAPKRRAARRQDRPLAARRRLPRRRQVGNQDAPRHPVHRQMMNAEQKTPRPRDA